MGAQLPTGYPEHKNGESGFPNQDSDFVRLAKYMGTKANSQQGYTPQVLPNLTYINPRDNKTYGTWFWSSTVHFSNSSYAYAFYTRNGVVDGYDRNDDYYAVRCVVTLR